MRMAILGTRGIPARYGGFETLAEELSARLASRGARRHGLHARPLRGAGARSTAARRSACCRRSPPSISTGAHGILSGFDAALERFDAVLSATPSTRRLRFFRGSEADAGRPERGRPRAQPPEVDALGKLAYRVSERLSTSCRTRSSPTRGSSRTTTGSGTASPPSSSLRRDLPEPEGTERSNGSGSRGALRALRFAPRAGEQRGRRCARLSQSAGRRSSRHRRRCSLRARLHRRAPPAGRPARSLPGSALRRAVPQLLAHAAVYVQATEVGGTHPALVEALGFGRVVCYNRSPDNEEVAGDAALPFDVRQPETLTRLLAAVLDDPAGYSVWKDRARARVRERYRWEDVATRYEALLEGRPAIP